MLTTELASYFASFTYISIFWLQTPIPLEDTAQDVSKFYTTTRRVLKITLIFSVIVCFLSVLIVFGMTNSRDLVRVIEALLSCIRDLIIAIVFLIYRRKLRNELSLRNYRASTLEAKVIRICLMLTIIPILHSLSTLMYIFYWADWSVLYTPLPPHECTLGYFATYTIEQIVIALFPLAVIGYNNVHEIFGAAPLPTELENPLVS
jgi:uncharacterized membrane protein